MYEDNSTPKRDPYDPDRADLVNDQDLDEVSELDFDSISADLEEDLSRFEHIQCHRPSSGTVAIVLTNLLEGAPLQAALESRGIAGEVVETNVGSLVWRQLGDQPEDDFQELLGEAAAAPPEAEELAKQISAITPYGAILMVAKLRQHQPDLWELEGDFPWTREYLRRQTDNLAAQLAQWEDQGVNPEQAFEAAATGTANNEPDEMMSGQVIGQIIARVYYDGQFDHQFAAGPLVAAADEIIEDLLLGRTTPADYRNNSRGGWFRGGKRRRFWG